MVPGFANAHGNPPRVYYRAICQCPCISTQVGHSGFAMDAMEIHTIQGRVCQCPWTSTMDAMEIHTIQVYPYRAGFAMDAMEIHTIQSTLIGPGFANAHGISTNLCSAMDAMEIHTIPVYPYRVVRVCQHAYPQITSLHYPQALPMPMEIHKSLQCHGCHGNPHYPSLPL